MSANTMKVFNTIRLLDHHSMKCPIQIQLNHEISRWQRLNTKNWVTADEALFFGCFEAALPQCKRGISAMQFVRQCFVFPFVCNAMARRPLEDSKHAFGPHLHFVSGCYIGHPSWKTLVLSRRPRTLWPQMCNMNKIIL